MAFCIIKKKKVKKQFFYIFDEHTDFVKECVKKGMTPLSDEMFVEEFDFNGAKYHTLGVHDIIIYI